MCIRDSPSEAPKVRYLSVKSGLPEISGILRRINRIISFHRQSSGSGVISPDLGPPQHVPVVRMT
eukprot:1023106-Karenia_brevis.AAC.1